jgi:hypothetical protein
MSMTKQTTSPFSSRPIHRGVGAVAPAALVGDQSAAVPHLETAVVRLNLIGQVTVEQGGVVLALPVTQASPAGPPQ